MHTTPEHANAAVSAAQDAAGGGVLVRDSAGSDGAGVGAETSGGVGGSGKHEPLMEATLKWLDDPSPKLIPPEDRLRIKGGMI
jgi:hypothetical protein